MPAGIDQHQAESLPKLAERTLQLEHPPLVRLYSAHLYPATLRVHNEGAWQMYNMVEVYNLALCSGLVLITVGEGCQALGVPLLALTPLLPANTHNQLFLLPHPDCFPH